MFLYDPFIVARGWCWEQPWAQNHPLGSFLDIESLPSDPTEQMKVIFHLLKDVHTRSLHSSKTQTELAADVKAIKTGQKSIETKITAIQNRLDELEENYKRLDELSQDIATIHTQTDELSALATTLQSRQDDLDDRSRRNNLIFYGIPDSDETWQATEEKLTSILSECLTDPLSPHEIERAHRLGRFAPNKCRPIIAKFLNFKTKDLILAKRNSLKESKVTISEDYSVATRLARKKLLDFAKIQPGSPTHKLRHNKLLMNKKSYMYDPITATVISTDTKSAHASPPSATISANTS